MKGGTLSSHPWVKILCPTLSTFFYCSGKHILKLEKGGWVSFKRAGRVSINGDYLLGATAVRHLSREEILEDNSGSVGAGRCQTWAQGTVRSINGKIFQPRHAVEFLTPQHQGRPQLISYEAATLVEGSQFLPPGSPVFFQAAVKNNKPNNKKKKNETFERPTSAEIFSLVYDKTRYAEHAGALPSAGTLGRIEGTVGKAHILLGSSSAIDPRAVSILDLTTGDDSPIEGASLDSLLKRALVILEDRRAQFIENLKHDQSNTTATKIEQIERTLKAHENLTPLHIFVSPNFISRKKWIDTINRHFNFGGDSRVKVGRVRIMEMASPTLNEANTDRITGLGARQMAEWHGADYQESHQLFRNSGPFVTLSPISQDGLMETGLDEDVTYTTTNTRHHLTNQILLITLSPLTPSRETVPCTVVDLAGEDRPATIELDLTQKPSLLIVYWLDRCEQAQKLLRTLVDRMGISFSEEVEHIDKRKKAVRVYMPGAGEGYLDDAVEFINNPEAEKLLHAGRWDKLHQDEDDWEARTLYCKAGFNPAHELLEFLDPDIQYLAITHGILRIFSRLATADLLKNMREYNKRELPLQKFKKNQRGDTATFQAINDAGGIHWAGPPPTPFTRRGNNAWGGLKSLNGPISIKQHTHRIMISGPAPSWTNKNLWTVMEAYGISQEAMAEARWATAEDKAGTFIEVSHDSVKDMQADAKASSCSRSCGRSA